MRLLNALLPNPEHALGEITRKWRLVNTLEHKWIGPNTNVILR
jgi:hypothetical protein